MIKNIYILTSVFVLGFVLFLTNGFADENGDFDKRVRDADISIPETDFEFPTPEGAAYIQDTPEFQRVPDRIIGTPDFEKMRDLPRNSPDYILGRKVGMLIIPYRNDPNKTLSCTGFLVGPDLFMTNHHCIYDSRGIIPFEDAKIFMDYYEETDIDPTKGGVTASVSEILHADALKDYALLRLNEPIGNTYGWLQLDTTTRVNSSQSVKLISHSRGRSKEIARRNSQILDIPADHPLNDVPFAVAYLADTEGGASGSPIFLRQGMNVIGIHHSAWTNKNISDFNAGTLTSYIVPEIKQWLPSATPPDLIVEMPRMSNSYLQPGKSFTLSATVSNQGLAASTATTLRFYQSLDNTITASDAELASAVVSSLTFGGRSEADITLTAPMSLGRYYYGVCIDPVADEEHTDNNCSAAAKLIVSTAPPPLMYWTDWGAQKIYQANLDGTDIKALITTGLNYPKGIAVDVAGGKIYWVDSGSDKIQRANLNGSKLEDLVTELVWPHGIALDVAGGKMYWADSGSGKIQRANLNGSNPEDLVTGLSTPYGIALDVADGRIYWVDSGSDKIQRANLNGSKLEDLVTGLSTPYGIALDVADGKMYWTDEDTRKIQRANLDGSETEDLITQLKASRGIALDVADRKMYWVDQVIGSGDRIRRANFDGTSIEDLVTTGLRLPDSIALSIPQVRGTITFNPRTIVDQTFTVGTYVNVQLPTAIGEALPYTYNLSPRLPLGLSFDPGTQQIRGTPTTAMPRTRFTYTARDATGASAALAFAMTVTDDGGLDVSSDGQVNVTDLVIVALFYGTSVPVGVSLAADVNRDGKVDVQDLILVADGISSEDGLQATDLEAVLLAAARTAALEAIAEAPISFDTPRDVLSVSSAYGNVADALVDTRHIALQDARLGQAVVFLKTLLQLLAEMGAIPEKTALLPNYPNPFNPETWIPYHLAKDAEVILRIYDVRGTVVRALMLGHQSAGIYESRGRAAYWDGKNHDGEPVSSGVYFYTLTAGDFTVTRKLLIAK